MVFQLALCEFPIVYGNFTTLPKSSRFGFVLARNDFEFQTKANYVTLSHFLALESEFIHTLSFLHNLGQKYNFFKVQGFCAIKSKLSRTLFLNPLFCKVYFSNVCNEQEIRISFFIYDSI